MIWEPLALAVVFGVIVSAAIYFVVMWPQVEPEDEDGDGDGGGTGSGPGGGPAADDDLPPPAA